MMDKNTVWLMEWNDRMVAKYGGGRDLCRELAYFVGEAGNDNPSDHAIEVAKEWEKNLPE